MHQFQCLCEVLRQVSKVVFKKHSSLRRQDSNIRHVSTTLVYAQKIYLTPTAGINQKETWGRVHRRENSVFKMKTEQRVQGAEETLGGWQGSLPQAQCPLALLPRCVLLLLLLIPLIRASIDCMFRTRQALHEVPCKVIALTFLNAPRR